MPNLGLGLSPSSVALDGTADDEPILALFTWTLSNFAFGEVLDAAFDYAFDEIGTGASGTLTVRRTASGYSVQSFFFETTDGVEGTAYANAYDSTVNSYTETSDPPLDTGLTMYDGTDSHYFALTWLNAAMYDEMEANGGAGSALGAFFDLEPYGSWESNIPTQTFTRFSRVEDTSPPGGITGGPGRLTLTAKTVY